MTTILDQRIHAASLGFGPIYDLGRPLRTGMPQSPNQPPFAHTFTRRHGDVVRPDGSSVANDLIVTGLHVGTHIDAFSHTSRNGHTIDGAPVDNPGDGGYRTVAADTIDPIVTRGALIDIPATLELDHCPAGYEITPDDLAHACAQQQTTPTPGDVLLIRTGWGRLCESHPTQYVGTDTGIPGIGPAAAAWLVEHRPRAVGSDTIPFERVPAGPRATMDVHTLLLHKAGVYIIEDLDLEQLSADRRYEFLFIACPLKIAGGTGSPIRPIALPVVSEPLPCRSRETRGARST